MSLWIDELEDGMNGGYSMLRPAGEGTASASSFLVGVE